MTPGAAASIIVGVVLTVLIGALGYFIKGRFDTQEAGMVKMSAELFAQQISITRLQESHKAVIENQHLLSNNHMKLIEDSEDLEDITNQLQLATHTLRERMASHDRFRQQIKEGNNGGRL